MDNHTLHPSAPQPAAPASPDFHLAGVSALVHFETCTKIEVETPRGIQLRTPRANVFQRRVYEAYETLLAAGVPEIRLLGLKIRQCGGTTCASHILYHHSQRFQSRTVTIANIQANSQAILAKMKNYALHDRFPWRNPLLPGETRLRWRNGSEAEITSAESLNPGISRTRTAALFSEACKYPRDGVKDDKRIMASVLPSVNQLAIAESTPEGASGWFYEQWHGTKDMPGALSLDDYLAALKRGERRPGNGWVKVFAAWHEFAENRRPVSEAERRRITATLTGRERRGMKAHGWAAEQIAWRRDVLRSECGGSEDLFDEYYPEDDHTCFLTSGRPRFDTAALIQQERHLHTQAVEEGHLDEQGSGGGVIFCPDSSGAGPIQLFEKPMPGCRYLLWCDPATGEDQTESRDPDRYSIGILRTAYSSGPVSRPHKVAARVKAPCTAESDLIVKYITTLSRYYGGCIIVLEINMGLHILEQLKGTGLPIYKREVLDPDDRSARRHLYGWKLKDRDQRRSVIDCLAIHLRDHEIDLSCPHILQEAKTFIIAKNGREEARPGTHDDDVMGLAMALYCAGSATLYKAPYRHKVPDREWKVWR